jgi:DNA-binding winged helix-turn-helix (wHTH) protein
MSRLRRRLGLNPENGFRIKTIYQRGYRLEAMKTPAPAVEDGELQKAAND